MLSKTNLYDRLLFLLIVCSAFGNIGEIFSPLLLLVVAISPFVFGLHKPSLINKGMVISAIILTYLFISLMWVPNTSRGLIYLLRIALNFLAGIEILILTFHARRPLISISYGWLIAFSLTAIIAVWELNTDHHLFNAKIIDIERASEFGTFDRHYACVTFYNPNTYSLFVIMAFPFILYLMQEHLGKIKSLLFYVLVIMILIYIVLKNGSRGCFISLSIMFITYFLRYIRSNRKGVVFFLTIILLIWFDFKGNELFDVIEYRNQTRGLVEDAVRPLLWKSSWDLFLFSYGFGQGCGSMVDVMHNYRGNVTPVDYCHNLFLELLLTGGVLVGFFYLYYILFILKRSIKMKNKSRKIVLLGSLLSLPVYGVVNSQYIYPTFIWVFFVSLYVFAFPISGRYWANN